MPCLTSESRCSEIAIGLIGHTASLQENEASPWTTVSLTDSDIVKIYCVCVSQYYLVDGCIYMSMSIYAHDQRLLHVKQREIREAATSLAIAGYLVVQVQA